MSTFTVTNANERHQQIARLAALGMRTKDIASQLGITTAMVRYTLNSPLMQRKVDMIRGATDAEAVDLWGKINEAAADAIQLCWDTMHNDEVPIKERLRQGRDFMDRGGFNAPKQVNVSARVAMFDAGKVEEMKQRAAATIVAGEVTDGSVGSD